MRKLLFIDVRGKRVESLTHGRLMIDAPRWQVTWGGVKVKLSRAPMLLVFALARRPGIVRERSNLLRSVANATTDNERALDSCVRNARKAFRLIDPDFDQIEGVYGGGYRWRPE